MPQVAAAVAADDLCPASIRVQLAGNRALHLIIKTGPSTARFEFIHRTVQQGITLFAVVISLLIKIIIFTSERPFCALLQEYKFLFGGQIPVFTTHILKPPLSSTQMVDIHYTDGYPLLKNSFYEIQMLFEGKILPIPLIIHLGEQFACPAADSRAAFTSHSFNFLPDLAEKVIILPG